MAAKASLALLAEALPAAWRCSSSADLLRRTMRDMNRTVWQVQLFSSEAASTFAALPAAAINVMTVAGRPLMNASLLGVFTVRFALADDLQGADLAWVRDPLDPSRSFSGSLGQVVYERHRALGYLGSRQLGHG